MFNKWAFSYHALSTLVEQRDIQEGIYGQRHIIADYSKIVNCLTTNFSHQLYRPMAQMRTDSAN